MSFYIRRMRREDVAQVTEIDRQAFATMWPPANYEREVNNQIAYYVVACDSEATVEPVPAKPSFASRLRSLLSFRRREPPPKAPQERILGFGGIWMMADEAHVTSIAVREEYRRKRIGEGLLIALIERTMELKARLMTLEVRVSNTAAQSLYSKYGFLSVGTRRTYYSDNREDAVIMTTDALASPPFQAQFQQLKQAYSRKSGTA
ncbi:MAG: ribosomal protein S18-alanine N-acetyltransferase [Chloroflexota bacterium]